MDEKLREDMADKSSDLHSSEDVVPERVNFMPFAKYSLRGMVKLIRYKDPTLRGGIGDNTLTLVFKEDNDAIFYPFLRKKATYFSPLNP